MFALIKYHKLGILNNRKRLSEMCRCHKFKSKMVLGLVPLEILKGKSNLGWKLFIFMLRDALCVCDVIFHFISFRMTPVIFDNIHPNGFILTL